MLDVPESFQFGSAERLSYSIKRVDTIDTEDEAAKYVNTRIGDVRIETTERFESAAPQKVFFLRYNGREWKVASYSSMNSSL